MDPDFIAAHKHCFKNRLEIAQSSMRGCFYCLAIFAPGDIKHWIDDDKTAMCPRCDIDSVIGSASGFAVGRDLLLAMEKHWFGTSHYFHESRQG